MRKAAVSCVLLLVVVMWAVGGAQGVTTVPRDVRAVVNGTFTFEWTGPGDWDYLTNGEAAGSVQHFGLSRLYTTHTPDFFTGALLDGSFSLVAANGDEISGIYDGLAWPTSETGLDYAGSATFVITGGTGRFSHATGTLDVTFTETFEDYSYALAHTTWKLAGTFYY